MTHSGTTRGTRISTRIPILTHTTVDPIFRIDRQRTAGQCLFLILALLGGCATGPRYDTSGVERKLTPQLAASNIAAARGAKVLWGGVIVNAVNTQGGTRIEVLGYPLDNVQRPQLDKMSLGRFLVIQNRYLEVGDYTQGRLLTVTGTVTETLPGKVGEATYTYPVVVPGQIYLWPIDSGRSVVQPRVQFGIGVIYH